MNIKINYIILKDQHSSNITMVTLTIKFDVKNLYKEKYMRL